MTGCNAAGAMRYCRPFFRPGGYLRYAFCQWRTRDGRPGTRVPEPFRDWVVETGSLTARMRWHCPEAFRLRPLAQGWRRPALEEAWRLGLQRERVAWTREVALCCEDQSWILARTVIPVPSLHGGNDVLRGLGARPLGELLFRGGGSGRDPLEVARLRRGDWLAQHLQSMTGHSLAGCWCRRRVHYLRGRPLMVTEVFLPALFHLTAALPRQEPTEEERRGHDRRMAC